MSKARQEADAKAAVLQETLIQENFPLCDQQTPLQPCVATLGADDSSEYDSTVSSQQPPIINSQQAEPCLSPVYASSVTSGSNELASPSTNDDSSTVSAASQVVLVSFHENLDFPDLSAAMNDLTGFDSIQSCTVPENESFTNDFTINSSDITAHTMNRSSTPVIGTADSIPSSTLSPPAPTGFKSPPPAAEIALRRNRRPLGLTPSYHSQPGPKTTSGEVPRRSGTSSPIRRITSATGFPPSRVMKSASGPRSPLYSEQQQNALLQSLQEARSPGLSSLTLNIIPGPPTPRTPACINQQSVRESTVSSTSSDDESRTFTFHIPQYTKVEDAITKTPPGTPGIPGFPSAMFVQHSVDETVNYAMTQDAPIFTPCSTGHSSFPPELAPEMPVLRAAPDYISSGIPSQPTTPSLPPTMGGAYFRQSTGNVEYSWPDSSISYGLSARSSPVGTKSKTFQFTPNMTPQSFGGQ